MTATKNGPSPEPSALAYIIKHTHSMNYLLSKRKILHSTFITLLSLFCFYPFLAKPSRRSSLSFPQLWTASHTSPHTGLRCSECSLLCRNYLYMLTFCIYIYNVFTEQYFHFLLPCWNLHFGTRKGNSLEIS